MLEECLNSNNKLIMWFSDKNWVLSCSLPLSFWRYKHIGIRLAIASMPNDEEVRNALGIYRVACQDCRKWT